MYQVTVVWQGLYATGDSALECALEEYDAGTRRAISTQVSIGLPTCAAPPE